MQPLDRKNVADYKRTLGQFCTGVTIITSLDGADPVGFTCQSFSALSMDPPMVLISPDKKSSTWPKIRKTGKFAVSVLSSTQQAISAQFGRSKENKFAGVQWSFSPSGLPIILDSLAWLDCEISQETDAGDHTLVLATVLELGVDPKDKPPLLFHRGKYVKTEKQETNIL